MAAGNAVGRGPICRYSPPIWPTVRLQDHPLPNMLTDLGEGVGYATHLGQRERLPSLTQALLGHVMGTWIM